MTCMSTRLDDILQVRVEASESKNSFVGLCSLSCIQLTLKSPKRNTFFVLDQSFSEDCLRSYG